jgi:2-succinyl-6-hydroxy-2,4-cyclohexadiene-1-carboxylate synthase
VNQVRPVYEWNYRLEGKSEGFPLLWLHGFMGTGDDWLELVQNQFSDYCNILINLPGHAGSVIPAKTQFTDILDALVKRLVASGFEKFIPIGYSMGGRIAFHLQQHVPERIPALIFLSSAPGLKTNLERQQRKIEDEQLMNKMEELGSSAFLEEWYSSGLFGEIKHNSALFTKLCHARSDNDARQLRQALELMGNGALASLWDHLKGIAVPALLMTGELDSKYFQLNQEINRDISESSHRQVAGAGHAFHLEKPLETARIIRHFLSEIIEGE